MPSDLLAKSGIAGAVAREIIRASRVRSTSDCAASRHALLEGVAYMAEWDRQGSPAVRHWDAFMADCAVMASRTAFDLMVTP